MSWLSRQFERKEGGTRGGNLVRRIAKATLAKLTLGIYDGTNSQGNFELW